MMKTKTPKKKIGTKKKTSKKKNGKKQDTYTPFLCSFFKHVFEVTHGVMGFMFITCEQSPFKVGS